MLDKLMQHGIGVGGGSSIKSVQHGFFSLPKTETVKNITVNAVDNHKSIVLISLYTEDGNVYNKAINFIADVDSPTNIRIERKSESNSSSTLYMSWQLVEFDNIKSIQKGQFTYSQYVSSEEIIPIENINMGKSVVFFTHTTTSIVANTANNIERLVRIKSNNELGIYTPQLGDIINWQVVEFN